MKVEFHREIRRLKMEFRKVMVSRNGTWKEIDFNELSKGDNFRLFEPSGESVSDQSGNEIFYSTSEPYKNDDGIWTIEIAS